MGGYFSLPNFYPKKDRPLCVVCNIVTNSFVFIDMECSKCKEQSRSYYHPHCFRNYAMTLNNDIDKQTFVCPQCSFNDCGV